MNNTFEDLEFLLGSKPKTAREAYDRIMTSIEMTIAVWNA